MELVVGIVLTTGRNPYGYKIYDTRSASTRIVKQLDEKAVYNPARRNDYIIYNDKGRVLENRDAKIVYLNGEEVTVYSHKKGYEMFSGNLTEPNVLIVNPSTYTVYEVEDEADSDDVSGIMDWDGDEESEEPDDGEPEDGDYEDGDYEDGDYDDGDYADEDDEPNEGDDDFIDGNDDPDDNGDDDYTDTKPKEVSTRPIQLASSSSKMQRIPLATNKGKLTAVIVQSEDQDTVYSQACEEYKVCIELKQAGVAGVRDLTLYTMERVADTFYCARLNLNWTALNLGRGIKIVNRTKLADGNFLLECESQFTFETESTVVQGSRYNNIYVIIDNKDEVLLSVTSYKELDSFLDALLSLDNTDAYPEYKEVFTLLTNKHLENPRVDLVWTGAGISRKDGGMYLLTHVKELDKEYWLRLLAVCNYEKFVSWADHLETDKNGETYYDMINGIEGIIKKKPDCHSDLIEARVNPSNCFDTQYKFAIRSIV